MNAGNVSFLSTGLSEIGERGSESRTKSSKIWKNVLPLPPNSARAVPKVEQNLKKLKKCSTAASKFGPRCPESRTKSQKIGKMFYSVTFAKNSVDSDYGHISEITVLPVTEVKCSD